ncbi:hypothetical protein J1605_010845 [Eschrichtius robustus]|uniref:Uncharacterized protein n=1 Tax=Eschrichtius robustus TaxID=9764 RepID=A0AB34GQX0_ESCRO|nr:hypothetical protein J1605_010845 [Eschrichtius robustus]
MEFSWRQQEQGREGARQRLAPEQGAGQQQPSATASRLREARPQKSGVPSAWPCPALLRPPQRNYSRPPPPLRAHPAPNFWPLPATVALHNSAPVTRKSILLSNCGTAAALASRETRSDPGSGLRGLRVASGGTCAGGPGRVPFASGIVPRPWRRPCPPHAPRS